MLMSKTNRFLIVANSILLVLLIVSSFIKKQHTEKVEQTVLLNPKYQSDVSKIQITAQQETLTIEKKGTMWIASLDSTKKSDKTDIRFYADYDIVNQFIKSITKIRKLYTISDTQKSWSDFSLDDASAISVTILGNNDNVYTKVYFGNQNQLTNRIFLRTDRTITSFETNNDFSQFLTTNFNYWSDPKIIAGLGISTKNTITALYWNSHPYLLPEKKAADAVNTLLSLRHGNIISRISVNDINKSTSVSQLSVEAGNGRILTLSFTKEKSETDSSITVYKVKSIITPSPADDNETKNELISHHSEFEISEWTYNKITTLFQQTN